MLFLCIQSFPFRAGFDASVLENQGMDIILIKKVYLKSGMADMALGNQRFLG